MTTTSHSPEQSPERAPEQQSIGGALQAWVDKIRGGDVGALPVVLGLVVLVIFFSAIKPDLFATERNVANLLPQAAPVVFIAMGLVFVLLLGEIDLGAGFTAGTGAAVMAVLLTKHGVAWPLAVLACVAFGVLVGVVLGALIAQVRIPSFVVTLASFLGLQGVLLLVIGEGGTISITDSTILAIMNNNLSPAMGWVLFVIIVAGWSLPMLGTEVTRRRAGLPGAATSLVAAKILALAVPLALVVAFLNQERSNNVIIRSLKGVPVIVPFTLVFLVLLTFLLTRTSFGRHVYAVGGNAEAARRAGINVSFIMIMCFVIGSAMAAVAGILYASYDNSVAPTTGGASTLLYAVGAAVIGGTSLFGGKGRVIDAILGGLVVAVIQNGLLLITQKSGIQYIVTGAVLLLAASVDAISRRQSAGSRR
ncbi:sugar ABC transporter permease [Kineosporia succinea]|uniref:Xylose transport system permease protein XylH n=1 Tax=Kineosporia succinea TaxID=84632 RepID=A0ABT9NVR7_9ACTN|nr:ABC transporter permease [Kineosporia succinea]MDP9824518.1 D-xylose transport system permease protein [Kineosporia succinea]